MPTEVLRHAISLKHGSGEPARLGPEGLEPPDGFRVDRAGGGIRLVQCAADFEPLRQGASLRAVAGRLARLRPTEPVEVTIEAELAIRFADAVPAAGFLDIARRHNASPGPDARTPAGGVAYRARWRGWEADLSLAPDGDRAFRGEGRLAFGPEPATSVAEALAEIGSAFDAWRRLLADYGYTV